VPNIQVIDGANNCSYDIFEVEEDAFRLIFPGVDQDVEFIDDFVSRVGDDEAVEVLNKIWRRPVEKKSVHGIHGTLFYELEFKKIYYPTKRESDLDVAI